MNEQLVVTNTEVLRRPRSDIGHCVGQGAVFLAGGLRQPTFWPGDTARQMPEADEPLPTIPGQEPLF